MVHSTIYCLPADKDAISEEVKREDMKGVEESSDDTKKKIKEEPFEDKVKLEDGTGETSAAAEKAMPVIINDAIREEMDRLIADNKRLENLVTEMHQRHHEITVKVRCVVYEALYSEAQGVAKCKYFFIDVIDRDPSRKLR
jgi:hypothetical protein